MTTPQIILKKFSSNPIKASAIITKMITKNQLKTRILKINKELTELKTPTGVITVPTSCLPSSKKIGDEITLQFTDKSQASKQTEAHYQALKKLLQEIIQ